MTFDVDDSFRRLREVLSSASMENAQTLCAILASWPEDELAIATSFVQEHLKDWPDELRVWTRTELPSSLAPLFPGGFRIEPGTALPPSGKLSLLAALPGKLLQTNYAPGSTRVWMEQDHRTFLRVELESGAQETFRFRRVPKNERFTLYPNGQHLLSKKGNEFQVWSQQKIVARAKVPKVPKGPGHYWSNYESWQLSREGTHLWYAGFNPEGKPQIYLFDALTLTCLDQLRPSTWLVWGGERPALIEGWGESPVWLSRQCGEECEVFYSNAGDCFIFCLFLQAKDGKIHHNDSESLEYAVNSCSDQRVFDLAFLPQGKAIVGLDDLSLFSVVDMDSEKRVLRSYNPLEPLFDGDEHLSLAPYEGRPSRYSLRCYEMHAHESGVIIMMEGDYWTEEDQEAFTDFPDPLYFKLCNATLTPLVMLPGSEVEQALGCSDWFVHGAGFAARKEDELHFYRWESPSA